ncbi:antibiotic biosynthesis monooxygenase [Streptomyces sp. HPF1205]|uniref:antibiotic biosynthesis monooxygenase n=1 Tax=Streptomyces sp. HPF1205 TaxID=2873262 RepID=UPI001CEE033C|nr:antibiotic biosynthesis monooxygenase [Streptomyces sp. HPF1205]
MPKIAADGKYLTVLNLFSTDAPEKQDSLLRAMREIVDAAAYPGWISSTVHSGQNSPGTANFIQWRSSEDLEARYAGEEFKHRTVPLFTEITTSIRLLQNEVVYTAQAPELKGVTEISPTRDDYTVIDILKVAENDQADLIEAVGAGQEWLLEVPGFRSNTVLKGLRARGLEGSFVVVYQQWADQASYDAFQAVPEDRRSAARRKSEARVAELVTERDGNTYRVVHTRSAAA